jgi:hypothetical protein
MRISAGSGYGRVSQQWRVAGAVAGMDFSTRLQVYKVDIHVDLPIAIFNPESALMEVREGNDIAVTRCR